MKNFKTCTREMDIFRPGTLCLFILTVLSPYSCKEIEGPEGLKSLLNVTSESAGPNCNAGGQKIEAGIDKNRNDILDPDEVGSKSYACNGVNGLTSLLNITKEASGSNCSAGGNKIDAGIDKNQNGVLEDSEIQVSKFLCNGNNYESQIRLTIIDGSFGLISPTLIIPNPENGLHWGLPDFDKNDYKGIDSIVFVVSDVQTRDNSSSTDVVGVAKIELYDITNNQVVPNSAILSDNATIAYSANVFNHLPNTRIWLGIKITGGPDFFTQVGKSYIFLYSSN